MSLNNCTLIRNYKIGKSESAWAKQGVRVRKGERPAGSAYYSSVFLHRWYDIYTDDQVEQKPETKPTHPAKLDKTQKSV